MKKISFVGMFTLATLLVGCGEDESSQKLATMKQQYTDLETKYEKLSTDHAKLKEQYDQVLLNQDISQDEQTEKTQAQLLKEHFVQMTPRTTQGPYQALFSSEYGYRVEEMMLSKQPTEKENAYELAFQQLFPELTFNEVVIHENQTITIDFHENSLDSPNLTDNIQVTTFLNMLDFFLYYNFPDLKAYYLYSNGEPIHIGYYGSYIDAQPNNGIDFEELSFDLHLQ